MKWFLFLIIFFCNFSALAQNVRPTTFDDRKPCEEASGTWREFGTSCVNSCYEQFDKYSICSRVSIFSCDCGKGRCWNDGTCISLKDYKKDYDIKQAEEQKILDKAKEKRKEAMKHNQEEVMKNIIAKKNAIEAAKAGADKAQDTSKQIVTNVNNAINNTNNSANTKPTQREPISLMPFSDKNQSDKKANNVPPLFAQTEQSKQNNEAATGDLPSFPVIQVPSQ